LLLYGSRQENLRGPITATGTGVGLLDRVKTWFKGEF
jgi:hypothetical protein